MKFSYVLVLFCLLAQVAGADDKQSSKAIATDPAKGQVIATIDKEKVEELAKEGAALTLVSQEDGTVNVVAVKTVSEKALPAAAPAKPAAAPALGAAPGAAPAVMPIFPPPQRDFVGTVTDGWDKYRRCDELAWSRGFRRGSVGEIVGTVLVPTYVQGPLGGIRLVMRPVAQFACYGSNFGPVPGPYPIGSGPAPRN